MVRDNVISMNTQKYMSRDGGEILKETRDKMAYSIELLSTAMSSKDIRVEPSKGSRSVRVWRVSDSRANHLLWEQNSCDLEG